MQGFELPTDNKLDGPPQMLLQHPFDAPTSNFFWKTFAAIKFEMKQSLWKSKMSVWASDMSLMFYSE